LSSLIRAVPQGTARISLSLLEDVTAKSRHPLEEGEPCLSNYLKRNVFAPLPDMARLRGNDTQGLSRLFAGAFLKTPFSSASMRRFSAWHGSGNTVSKKDDISIHKRNVVPQV
jgi:hypothetical protein